MASTAGNEFVTTWSSGYGNQLNVIRKWGVKKNVVEPYLSGYIFIKFENIPNEVGADAANMLSSSCIGVTFPGATLNKTETMGLGGIKYGVPTTIDQDNTVVFRFLEGMGLPIYNIIKKWIYIIRNPITGIAGVPSKASYAANAYYWTTTPDLQKVNFVSLLAGVWPTKLPSDTMGHEIATVDKVEMDVDFHVDYVFTNEDWLYNKVSTFSVTTQNVYGNIGA